MKNELKMDTQKCPENIYAVRMLIVRMHKKGLGLMAIREQTGVRWGAIRKAIDLYEEGGAAALKPRRRGRRVGSSRTLTAEQERKIQKDICEKRPEQLKMDFALWTREAVLVYVREHFGIDMPVRTVSKRTICLATARN